MLLCLSRTERLDNLRTIRRVKNEKVSGSSAHPDPELVHSITVADDINPRTKKGMIRTARSTLPRLNFKLRLLLYNCP